MGRGPWRVDRPPRPDPHSHPLAPAPTRPQPAPARGLSTPREVLAPSCKLLPCQPHPSLLYGKASGYLRISPGVRTLGVCQHRWHWCHCPAPPRPSVCLPCFQSGPLLWSSRAPSPHSEVSWISLTGSPHHREQPQTPRQGGGRGRATYRMKVSSQTGLSVWAMTWVRCVCSSGMVCFTTAFCRRRDPGLPSGMPAPCSMPSRQ